MSVSTASLIDLDGGTFLMGSEDPGGFPEDGEGPVREVAVEPFRIAAHAVTNDEFAAFVAADRPPHEAERFGWSFVFAGLLPADFPPTRAVAQAPVVAPGARARTGAARGPGVVDRRARRSPRRARLLDRRARLLPLGGPAAADRGRVGVRRARRARAEALPLGRRADARRASTAATSGRGASPTTTPARTGIYGTAPVDSFEPNGFGLFNTSGNAWEWCADWFDAAAEPGPGRGKVIRGGSYLCHESYCNRYRVAARSRNTPDSSTGHMGFRVAAD